MGEYAEYWTLRRAMNRVRRKVITNNESTRKYRGERTPGKLIRLEVEGKGG